MTLAVLTLAVAGCGGGGGGSSSDTSPASSSVAGDGGPGRATTAGPSQTFEAGGVRVAVAVARWDGTRGTVTATLRPPAGFHLYGTDLPRGGVDGVGQRTELRAEGSLRATGRLRADARSRDLRVRSVSGPLRVYPAGPVRVGLPVRRSGAGDPVVSLSFGACSAEACGPPVVDRRVAIVLPSR